MPVGQCVVHFDLPEYFPIPRKSVMSVRQSIFGAACGISQIHFFKVGYMTLKVMSFSKFLKLYTVPPAT